MMASGIYLPLSGSCAHLIRFMLPIWDSLFQERRVSVENYGKPNPGITSNAANADFETPKIFTT